MRRLVVALWAAGLLAGLAGPAPGQDTPRAVIERAIKAHGGRERLGRVRADKVKLKGTLTVGTKSVPFTAETTVQLPGQFKSVVQLTAGNDKHTVVHILNGDKGSIALDGQPQKLEPAALAEMRETLQLDRAVRLVPLLTDKSFTLSSLGESKGAERTVVGIKVTAKGRRELRMYFDKDSGFLVKTEHMLEDKGREVRQEELYSDFRDVGGYKRPIKVSAYRDGKKVMDAEMLEVRSYDRIDPVEFTKP